jgi:hypothetical protein
MSIKIPIKTPKVVTATTKATNDGDMSFVLINITNFKTSKTYLKFIFYFSV